MIGIIAYSFAWRHHGDSPCNVRLANAVRRIIAEQTEDVVIVAQRAVARLLLDAGIPCYIIQKRPGYEGSEEVTTQAAEIFAARGVTKVIAVAQPVFQIVKCRMLIGTGGFSQPSLLALMRLTGWIGFDLESAQPWTRDFGCFFIATIRQAVLNYHPPAEFSEP